MLYIYILIMWLRQHIILSIPLFILHLLRYPDFFNQTYMYFTVAQNLRSKSIIDGEIKNHANIESLLQFKC